jgi:hypothetical protein
LLSRTMKHALLSSISQGGGKRLVLHRPESGDDERCRKC